MKIHQIICILKTTSCEILKYSKMIYIQREDMNSFQSKQPPTVKMFINIYNVSYSIKHT